MHGVPVGNPGWHHVAGVGCVAGWYGAGVSVGVGATLVISASDAPITATAIPSISGG